MQAIELENQIRAATALQDESYAYDDVGNVTQRQKYNRLGGNLNEDFHYDALNRLETSIVTSPALGTVTNLAVRYDEIGNIIGRSDVANNVDWQYDPVRKHALIQAGPTQYKYDENGNVRERNGFAIDWTSYNYPSIIRGPSKTLTFSYGPDRQRYRQVYDSGGVIETTAYIGGALEKVNAGGVDDWRHYISAGGQTVAIISRKSGLTTTRYLLNDHLGSIAAITDSAGAPILTESFDAFGARRDGEDWDSDCNCSSLAQIASITRHGFTGHEMIGGHSMGLIHMNGRVMDSVTGRFLSPDPFVQFPFDSQSFNRYSYVRNNPLSATDPSGFQEYDGDVRETPDWEPSICWLIGGCGVGRPIWFPRPYVIIVNRPEPKIPPSRATPPPEAGPAVLSKEFVIGAIDSTLQASYESPIIDNTGMMHPSFAEQLGRTYESQFDPAETNEAQFARDLGPTLGVVVALIARQPGSVVKGGLVEKAAQIRNAGLHPAARNQRTIAVGEDASGQLYAGSSNGFDRGQRAAAEAQGITCVGCKAGAHAEENLMREVPGLRRVGTSARAPCGRGEHNCAGQLEARGIDIDN